MATKQAGELVAGDVWREHDGKRRRLRAVEVRPGPAPTIVRIVAKNIDTATVETVDLYRVNVVVLVAAALLLWRVP
jgi:hypothetical protein